MPCLRCLLPHSTGSSPTRTKRIDSVQRGVLHRSGVRFRTVISVFVKRCGNDGIHDPPLFPFIVPFPRSTTQANFPFTHTAVPSCADSHVSCAPPSTYCSRDSRPAFNHSAWCGELVLGSRPPTTLPLPRRQLSSRPNKVSWPRLSP